MLCYAMLCYAMLCYAMLCYAMLCYAMLCYARVVCTKLYFRCESSFRSDVQQIRQQIASVLVANSTVEVSEWVDWFIIYNKSVQNMKYLIVVSFLFLEKGSYPGSKSSSWNQTKITRSAIEIESIVKSIVCEYVLYLCFHVSIKNESIIDIFAFWIMESDEIDMLLYVIGLLLDYYKRNTIDYICNETYSRAFYYTAPHEYCCHYCHANGDDGSGGGGSVSGIIIFLRWSSCSIARISIVLLVQWVHDRCPR